MPTSTTQARIAGLGWVTPLGADLNIVWQRLENGDTGEAKALANPATGRIHHYLPVPPKLVDQLGRNPRLRRSSAISYFAVAAGLAALEDAGVVLTPEVAARTAVVFAISSGGVVYTRKFYEQIVRQSAPSPLLFPETVYNAPASHLAAQLGIDGASYTLVGDASVGLSALNFAEQLLAIGDIDRCVVVGAEEADWVLCEAYHDWRLATSEARAELRAASPRGALLAEGAAALVLSREGRYTLKAVHDGVTFQRQRESRAALARVLAELPAVRETDAVVSCANGTFIDHAEAAALTEVLGQREVRTYDPKGQLGEALGASALIQTVVAALALEHTSARSVLVPVIGFNQQASAAVLGRAS